MTIDTSFPQARHNAVTLSRDAASAARAKRAAQSRRVATRRWKINVTEPTLDDLLADDVMIPVMRSAGVTAEALRAGLREAACRLARAGRPDGSGGYSCQAAL